MNIKEVTLYRNLKSRSISLKSKTQGITKEELKDLLKLTQSERERECICYAVYRASGATPTEACRCFSFQDMKSRASRVEACIKEAQDLYEAVDDLAHVQDQAVLDSLGIVSSGSEESSGEESDCPPINQSGQYFSFDCDHSEGKEMLIVHHLQQSLEKVTLIGLNFLKGGGEPRH